MPENDTTQLIGRVRNGDNAARTELIGYAQERLRLRSRKMLRGFHDLRGVEQTDDVLQNALMGLNRAFDKGTPLESGKHFWNRATEIIRHSLVDLARKHRGRNGQRPRQLTCQDDGEGGPLRRQADEGGGPQSLVEWTEFHEQVEALPAEEKEVFGLRWYGGRSHQESATLLGVSESEVKSRWQSARIILAEKLNGERPR